MNLVCLLYGISNGHKICCGKRDEDLNSLSKQRENEKSKQKTPHDLKIFEGFLEICNESNENFCSVRAEQSSKVRSEKEVEKVVVEKKTNDSMKIWKGKTRVCKNILLTLLKSM